MNQIPRNKTKCSLKLHYPSKSVKDLQRVGILGDSQGTLLFDVPAGFRETHPLGEADLFMPVTGWDNRPETLYLRTQP